MYVCLSDTRVLCEETKEHTADTLIPHERAITLVFRYQQRLGRRPLPPIICGQSDPSPLKSADFDQYLLITSQQ